MSALWVDTDAGFDDIWALLLLRANGVEAVGVSLVAGNTPLSQVEANALAAAEAYDLGWPLWRGADRPLQREPINAARILGSTGMRTRGRTLPTPSGRQPVREGAIDALRDWLLDSVAGEARVVLCLGPLTNIAQLVQQAPTAASRITRLVWMGGSDGPGNHTAAAEFNALADPHAVAVVLDAGVPFDIVDLMLCRQVVFGDADMTDRLASIDPLTADLLGGYLDIALTRGRTAMAIYDPVAALVVSDPARVGFEPRRMTIEVGVGDDCGATRFMAIDAADHTPDASGRVRLAVHPDTQLAADCLAALTTERLH